MDCSGPIVTGYKAVDVHFIYFTMLYTRRLCMTYIETGATLYKATKGTRFFLVNKTRTTKQSIYDTAKLTPGSSRIILLFGLFIWNNNNNRNFVRKKELK